MEVWMVGKGHQLIYNPKLTYQFIQHRLYIYWGFIFDCDPCDYKAEIERNFDKHKLSIHEEI